MNVQIPDLDAKGLRHFAFTVGAAIALIFGAALPFVFEYKFAIWPWIVALVLMIWGIIAPASMGPVYKGWMNLSVLIGKVTSPIVLGVVFVLLILPIGLIFRVARRDTMKKHFDSGKQTYKDVADDRIFNDLERPF